MTMFSISCLLSIYWHIIPIHLCGIWRCLHINWGSPSVHRAIHLQLLIRNRVVRVMVPTDFHCSLSCVTLASFSWGIPRRSRPVWRSNPSIQCYSATLLKLQTFFFSLLNVIRTKWYNICFIPLDEHDNLPGWQPIKAMCFKASLCTAPILDVHARAHL